jgi:hypothetical protein
VSAGTRPPKGCGVFLYLPEETSTIPATLRNHATPRRRKGKAHPFPTSHQQRRPRKGGAALGWPPTSSPARRPPTREKRNKQANASSSHGPDRKSKMPRRPGRVRHNAISRRRPRGTRNQSAGLNSETLPVPPRFPRPKPPPTTTTHRLRLTRGEKKENGQFRCGLVGVTTARKGKVRIYWSGSR